MSKEGCPKRPWGRTPASSSLGPPQCHASVLTTLVMCLNSCFGRGLVCPVLYAHQPPFQDSVESQALNVNLPLEGRRIIPSTSWNLPWTETRDSCVPWYLPIHQTEPQKPLSSEASVSAAPSPAWRQVGAGSRFLPAFPILRSGTQAALPHLNGPGGLLTPAVYRRPPCHSLASPVMSTGSKVTFDIYVLIPQLLHITWDQRPSCEFPASCIVGTKNFVCKANANILGDPDVMIQVTLDLQPPPGLSVPEVLHLLSSHSQ